MRGGYAGAVDTTHAMDDVRSAEGASLFRIWTPPDLQVIFSFGYKVQLHSYIRPLIEHRRARAIMESARLLQIALAALSRKSSTGGLWKRLVVQAPV